MPQNLTTSNENAFQKWKGAKPLAESMMTKFFNKLREGDAYMSMDWIW